jgi:hypothetical protein
MKKTTYKNAYFEKLKDPRWQKKRLEILNIHDFTCQECGNADNTLHVHHPFYEKNKDPWDYESDVLMCVCDSCHSLMHYQENIFDSYAKNVKSGGNGRSLMFYAGLLAGFSHDGPFDIDIPDYEFAEGLGIAFNKTADDVVKSISTGNNTNKGAISWKILAEWSKGKKEQ